MVDIFTPSIWGPIQELPGPQGAMMFKCALKPKDRRSDTILDVEDDGNHVWQDTNMPLIWREVMYTGKCQIMTELFAAHTTLMLYIIKQLGNSSYIEVGCRTDELGAVL